MAQGKKGKSSLISPVWRMGSFSNPPQLHKLVFFVIAVFFFGWLLLADANTIALNEIQNGNYSDSIKDAYSNCSTINNRSIFSIFRDRILTTNANGNIKLIIILMIVIVVMNLFDKKSRVATK